LRHYIAWSRCNKGKPRGNVAKHENVNSREEFARCKEALGRVT
jgi:hypothetical protein